MTFPPADRCCRRPLAPYGGRVSAFGAPRSVSPGTSGLREWGKGARGDRRPGTRRPQVTGWRRPLASASPGGSGGREGVRVLTPNLAGRGDCGCGLG